MLEDATFLEMFLINVLHPEIRKGPVFTHISMSADAGIPHGIKFIPKKQGFRFLNLLPGQLERVRKAQHHHSGSTSKKAEGIKVKPLVVAHPKETKEASRKESTSPETVKNWLTTTIRASGRTQGSPSPGRP